MKIVFPKEIFLAAHRFEIKENPEHNGGSFSLDDNLIEIGTLSMAKDPHYSWMVINHEVFEAAVTALGYRYRDASVDGNYKFFMDHKEFENVVSIASMALCKFIPQDDTPAEVVVGEAN